MDKVQVDEQGKNLNQTSNNCLEMGQTAQSIDKKQNKVYLWSQLTTISILGVTIIIVFLICFTFFQLNSQKTRVLSAEKSKILESQIKNRNEVLYPIANHPLQGQHKHPVKPLQYVSLGVPRNGDIFNYSRVCLSNFSEYEKHLYEFFRPYNDTDCQYAIYGSNGNQSYVLCKNLIGKSEALLNIGQDGKDSFGCSISSEYKIPNYLYQCKKHSYFQQDCPNNSKLTNFERKCFGDEVQKVEDYDYTLINKQIDLKGLYDKNIIVKINLGGNQWTALRNVPLQYLQKIDQLILVVYLPHESLRNTVYWGNLDIINSLKEKFVSVYLHLNNMFRIKIAEMKEMQRKYSCAVFYVTLVNKNVIKIKSETRSYNQKIQSYKNNPNDDYIQIKEE